ncbi:hypothetical protein D6779_09600 [Candidatus Parcubacteria bacterium]|nr:MAG: hypothetical protein D6779_09600 [Candidatus Parcubacteria bacterium]
MPRIRVDTDVLKQEARKLGNISASALSAGRALLSATDGAPSYDGQFGSVVRSIAGGGFARTQAIAGRMGELGEKLNRTADAFEAADMVARATIEGYRRPIQSLGKDIAWLWQYLSKIPSEVKRYMQLGELAVGFLDKAKDVIERGAGSILYLGAFPRDSSVMIVPGSFRLKKLAGVSDHLTVIGNEKFLSRLHLTPGAMANSALKSAINYNPRTLDGALNVAALAFKWGQDYFAYRDEGASKVAAAMIVDAGLEVATSAVGGAAGGAFGSWVGGAIGGALGSVIPVAGTAAGAAVGSAIGGFVGKIAGKWAANLLVERLLIRDHSVRDYAVDLVSKGIDARAHSVAHIASTAAQGIDRSINNVVRRVTDIFSPKVFGF